MSSESEKPWIDPDSLPWPPRRLRPYIKQDNTQDWKIVDDSIPDDLRKEFEEWYTVFLEVVKRENNRYKKQLEQDRYDEIWRERKEALRETVRSSKKDKVIKFGFSYLYTIGFVVTDVRYYDMSLEELEEYVKILNEAHKNWLAVVKKQENTPGYLPEGFDEENLELIRRDFPVTNKYSFHETIDFVERAIAEINKFYYKKMVKTKVKSWLNFFKKPFHKRQNNV